jgi:hypothetical protein
VDKGVGVDENKSNWRVFAGKGVSVDEPGEAGAGHPKSKAVVMAAYDMGIDASIAAVGDSIAVVADGYSDGVG